MLSEQVPILVNLIAKRFIQRSDLVAIQTQDKGYMPWRTKDRTTGEVVPGSEQGFTRPILTQHLMGEATYGHYQIDQNNLCKLFCLDIDLAKGGFVPTRDLNPEVSESDAEADFAAWVSSFVFVPDLRAVWHSRQREWLPARTYIKRQFRVIAHMFATSVNKLLEIDVAATYTGNKGVHVYGFCDTPTNASFVRDGAELVLGSLGIFTAERGDNFFVDKRRLPIPYVGTTVHPDFPPTFKPTVETFDPGLFHNMHVEVFPKQRSIEDDGLGSLIRLPLGKNLKNPQDPTFFIDLASPMDVLRPVDPVFALTTNNPWISQSESAA